MALYSGFHPAMCDCSTVAWHQHKHALPLCTQTKDTAPKLNMLTVHLPKRSSGSRMFQSTKVRQFSLYSPGFCRLWFCPLQVDQSEMVAEALLCFLFSWYKTFLSEALKLVANVRLDWCELYLVLSPSLSITFIISANNNWLKISIASDYFAFPLQINKPSSEIQSTHCF